VKADQNLAELLAHLPEKLNEAIKSAVPVCPTCGRPMGGFLRPGETREQTGICACSMPSQGHTQKGETP
jgi:formate dehydrogenase maturation protein FdhE